MTVILTIPGLWNSGPQHWQTLWEGQAEACPPVRFRRVQQRNWHVPDRAAWVETLDAAVRAAAEPPVLAAHSLGCTLVAQWAKERGGRGVRGAFLVAPSDIEAPRYPPEARSFDAMPLDPLPFPSVVVASADDEWVTLDRAAAFARAWGSRFVDIGAAGHINGASGYGPWPEGQAMLFDFCAALKS